MKQLEWLMKGGGVPTREPNSEKYYINCHSNLDKSGSTQGWINLLKMFKKVATRDIDLQKSQVLLADKHGQEIVVKLGHKGLDREYEIGRKLKTVKGFVKFICYFECEDDFYKYFKVESGHFCKAPGNSMQVIVMPYYPLGSLARYNWTPESLDLLKSCLKQAVLSIIYAYDKKQIVHGDFHAMNVMLKATKQQSIDIDGITVPTHGIRTWIMDFENSYVATVQTHQASSDFFFDLKKFFMLLPTFIPHLDKRGIDEITRLIFGFQDKNECNRVLLCDSIDKNIQFLNSISIL